MTTSLGTQFADLAELEKEFVSYDTCRMDKCGKSPTTHHALCPEGNCTTRGAVCIDHATEIMQAKHERGGRGSTRFKACGHLVPKEKILLFPK